MSKHPYPDEYVARDREAMAGARMLGGLFAGFLIVALIAGGFVLGCVALRALMAVAP